MWGFPSVETVLRDVRYAIRILAGRSPMFAAIAILSLGIGIGSAAAVYTRSMRCCCESCRSQILKSLCCCAGLRQPRHGCRRSR